MPQGSFQDFLDAMRAFESGWDRDRYETGRITDTQLTQWAGGPVQSFYPQYTSWGQLSDSEWKAMSYTSTNALGFVGYQFGEALLIDLGYYDDDVFYGSGAATNTWDGTWTGKNGVDSLADFKTETAQEVAIREAFGFNLKIIDEGLSYQGESLEDYVGTTRTYQDGGATVNVTLTLTGIMAAAHLRGAYGTLNLLQAGNVYTDEYGTSILRYISDFGGYDAPSVAEAIDYFESRVTGDEGLGVPGDGTPDTGGDGGGMPGGGEGGGGSDNAAITAANATHVIDWAWGQTVVDPSFDPATDTIFISWIAADSIDITQTAQGVVFSVPSNNQSLTLAGVTLDDLDMSRIRALDETARAELASLISHTGGDVPGDGGHDTGGGAGSSDGHGGMAGEMTTITLTSGDQTVAGFDPSMDMVHIEGGITAERLQIFEESGDALGLTTRIVVLDAAGGVQSTTILLDIGLDDLSMANFSIAEQSALNEVVAAINAVVTNPGGSTDGFPVTYNTDGSNPVATTGQTELGGTKFLADINADDITGFDPNRDEIDVGGTSVHGLIITKTPNGELALDSPWSAAMQIVQGAQITDLTMANFGIVGNEHLRQDLGGVMSWELGIGPREADTIYVRSHEYGVSEVIDNFDPGTMKISFLYFGTRERLSVEDTSAGLVISSLPTGQSMTLTGVTKADLIPGLIEFHHDQVVEDNLEIPFGYGAEQVTLVSRAGLLTPDAPVGASTDGFQTRLGDMTGAPGGEPDPGDGGGNPDPGGNSDTGGGLQGYETLLLDDATADTAEISWDWAKKTAISGFDVNDDVIDLNALGSGQVTAREADGNLYFEVVGNGGNSTALMGIQAEDLSMSNLTALGWNTVLSSDSDLMVQLTSLGFDMI